MIFPGTDDVFLVLRWFTDKPQANDFGGIIGVFTKIETARQSIIDDSGQQEADEIRRNPIHETHKIDDNLKYTITRMKLNESTTFDSLKVIRDEASPPAAAQDQPKI